MARGELLGTPLAASQDVLVSALSVAPPNPAIVKLHVAANATIPDAAMPHDVDRGAQRRIEARAIMRRVDPRYFQTPVTVVTFSGSPLLYFQLLHPAVARE